MTETDAVMIRPWSAWSRADDASIGCHSVAPNKINPGRASPISNIRRIPTRRKVRCGWKGKISYQIRAQRFSKESLFRRRAVPLVLWPKPQLTAELVGSCSLLRGFPRVQTKCPLQTTCHAGGLFAGCGQKPVRRDLNQISSFPPSCSFARQENMHAHISQ